MRGDDGFIVDNILARIVVLERLEREREQKPESACDDPDAEMLDDHARRGANDDETD